jgi:hypothetical protein
MHKASMLRMKWFVDEYVSQMSGAKIKVLDVGSYNVNGTYKDLFANERYEYVGMDMEPGPNVDVVFKNPYVWSEIATDSYDVVISGQTFEHAEFFWVTMSEMTRVLKKNGLLCIIVPNVLHEHRYPVDCYRFYSDGLLALCRYVRLDTLHVHTNCAPKSSDKIWYSSAHSDSMVVATKPYSGATQYVDLNTYVCVPSDHDHLRTGLIPYSEKNFIIRKLRKWLNKRDYRKQRMRGK